MTAPATEHLITTEEFLHMKEQEGAELVDGRIVEGFMSGLSRWVGGKMTRLIGNFLDVNEIGWVFPPDSGFAIWPNRPGHLRKPDVAFVRNGKFAGGLPPSHGWITDVPDLVVEVVCPGDEAEDLEQKVIELRDAGVPLIWLIFPITRTAQVIRPGRPRRELKLGDHLDGEDILPGFRVPLSDVFPRPERSK